MNHSAQFLLDAIGLLDDDLIQDAELAPPIPAGRGRSSLPYYLSVCAAGLILCLGLTAFFPHFLGGFAHSGLNSAPSGSASPDVSGPATSAPATSAPAGSDPYQEIFSVYTARGRYLIRPESCTVSQDGLLFIGRLAQYQNADSPLPATNDPSCVGLTLWQAENGVLYIQVNVTTWLRCFPAR